MFLKEEVFAYIEPIIERRYGRLDHCGNHLIDRTTWKHIVADLERLWRTLSTAKEMADVHGKLGFATMEVEREFAQDFAANKAALMQLLEELVDWVREQLLWHRFVSVLGL